MFAKRPAKAKPEASSAYPALTDQRRPAKVASVIADDLSIEGGIVTDGDIHVDGAVRGDVTAGSLTLGETGHVQGNITADTIEVRGRVVGSITAKVVKLLATAYVEGDVTHDQLCMENGAYFQGRSQKLQRPAAPVAADGKAGVILQPLGNDA